MNTGLRKNAKNDFKKYFFKFTNNAVFRKSVDNVRSKKVLFGIRSKLLAKEMKRRQILKNKPVYLCLSIFEIDKIVMYELWYDYKKQKFGKKKQNHVTRTQAAL